jgi:hypothetical protein
MLRVLGMFAGIVARIAIVLGMALILGKTAPSIPNRVYRLVFFFAVCVPFSFAINYVDVWLLGYHKVGWTGVCIIALLPATIGTFWPPKLHNSKSA